MFQENLKEQKIKLDFGRHKGFTAEVFVKQSIADFAAENPDSQIKFLQSLSPYQAGGLFLRMNDLNHGIVTREVPKPIAKYEHRLPESIAQYVARGGNLVRFPYRRLEYSSLVVKFLNGYKTSS